MSGPKHLWSGDWENESEDASAQITRRPRPRDPQPETPTPPAPARPRARRTMRPWAVPVAIGLIVIAAAAFAATQLIGPSNASSSQSPAAIAAKLNKPKLTGSTAPIRWLGMEIITAPQGIPMVETVRPNSNGDRAGLEPGDAILLVNNRPVGASGSIASAIKGLHSGDRVALEITNGGAMFQLWATLAAPPSPYP